MQLFFNLSFGYPSPQKKFTAKQVFRTRKGKISLLFAVLSNHDKHKTILREKKKRQGKNAPFLQGKGT